MLTIEELIEKDKELYELAKKSINIIKECKGCGWCCQNSRILVTIPEIIRILKHTVKDFSDVFVIEKNKLSVSIKTKKVNGKPYCIFYDNGKCRIHNIKPFQCMTYPAVFHPCAMALGVVKEHNDKRVVFECQSPKGEKAVYEVLIEKADEITIERVNFLIENYKLQRKLIAQRMLKKVVEEYAMKE